MDAADRDRTLRRRRLAARALPRAGRRLGRAVALHRVSAARFRERAPERAHLGTQIRPALHAQALSLRARDGPADPGPGGNALGVRGPRERPPPSAATGADRGLRGGGGRRGGVPDPGSQVLRPETPQSPGSLQPQCSGGWLLLFGGCTGAVPAGGGLVVAPAGGGGFVVLVVGGA